MLAARGLKPMSWLSSPKVRLALIVNGLYFISLFTPTARHGRPDFFARARATQAGRSVPTVQPDPAMFPPPSGPSRTSAFESGGHLHVSLNDDLTLVNRPGHKLVLSPSFDASAYPPAEPKSVLFNFILYTNADAETCPGSCPLTIKADAEVVWPERFAIDPSGHSYSWKRESVPHSSDKLEDGGVVETMGAELFSAEIPYDTFLDIISARSVVVRLGPDWVELSTEQMEALRDMHRRLPRQSPPDDTKSY
jgi:hypothetical protein